jgi:L-lactate dehydrogenase complex protein LldG
LPDVLHRVAPDGLVLVPRRLPHERTEGRDVLRDDGSASTQDLDSVAAVVTGCAAAVAQTRHPDLDAGPEPGPPARDIDPRRAVCVVGASQVAS